MGDIMLLLLSLISASRGGKHDQFMEECTSHCSSKHDEDLSCWNKTAQFFSTALLGVFLRYVTTQVNILIAAKEHHGKLPFSDEIAKKSIDRIMEYLESDFSNKGDTLTAELINKTIITFVSASFETIKVTKRPALLPCPRDCERPSKFWLSWSFISLLLSGILTAIIIIKTLEKDRIDQNYALVEEAIETDKRKAN